MMFRILQIIFLNIRPQFFDFLILRLQYEEKEVQQENCRIIMYKQIPSNYQSPGQIDILQPESRSSLDHANTPFINSHSYLQEMQHNFGTFVPILFSNQQLHQLVSTSDKIFEPELKRRVQRYVSMVMHLNNIAHYFICKLQNKERKSTQIIQNAMNIQDKIQQNSTFRKKQKSNFSLSPQPGQNSHTDKLQLEICTMLNEAQRILQYAASCGKNIDRKIIICVLNNQACFYQKVWQLQKSCSYIQATIMNMQQWGQQSNWSEISSSNSITKNSIYSNHPIALTRAGHQNIQQDVILANMRRQRLPKSQGDFSTQAEFTCEEQKQKLAQNYQLLSNCESKKFKQNFPPLNENQHHPHSNNSHLTQKDKVKELAHHMIKLFELSIYYLQYSSLCGQLNHHDKAIQTTKKVIGKIRKIIAINRKYYLGVTQSRLEQKITKFLIRQKNKSNINSKDEVSDDDDIIEIDNRKIIIGLSEIDDELPEQINEKVLENYRQAARFYLKQYDVIHGEKQNYSRKQSNQRNIQKIQKQTRNHHKSNSFKQSKQSKKKEQFEVMEEDLIEMSKIREELKNFSISDILQIRSRNYKYHLSTEERHSDISNTSKNSCDQNQERKGINGQKSRAFKQTNSIFKYLPNYLFSSSQTNSPICQQNQQMNFQFLNYSLGVQNILMNLNSVGSNTTGYPFLISVALLLATSYFILATELRLQAAKDEVKEGQRFQKKIYKQSELYHIIAILILSIYVPLSMKYLRHIVSSYENYYVKQLSPIDQMKNNQYQNAPNKEKKISYSNIALRNKFDKQGIFKYPKIQTKKQKQLVSSINKVINKQITMLSHTQNVRNLFPKHHQDNQQNTSKERQFDSKYRNMTERSEHYESKKQYGEENNESSEDRIYESLFDLEKRKKMEKSLKGNNYNMIEKDKNKNQYSSKSNSHNKKQQKLSASESPRNIGDQDAYGNKNQNRIPKLKKTLVNSIKAVKLQSFSIKKAQRRYQQQNYIKSLPSPQKSNNLKNDKKLDTSKNRKKLKSNPNNIHAQSRSIIVIPNKKSNQVKTYQTGKNSEIDKKLDKNYEPKNLEQNKNKKKQKMRRSSKQLRFQHKNRNEYKIDGQKDYKNNDNKTNNDYTSQYGSKERPGTKSKSRSQDKIKKINTTNISDQKEYLRTFQNALVNHQLGKANSERNFGDTIGIPQTAQKEEDFDIYKIHTSSRDQQGKVKGIKKVKKQKRGGSRACSISRNQIVKSPKVGVQSPKIISTTYSSHLTVTPKNQSSRKIVN